MKIAKTIESYIFYKHFKNSSYSIQQENLERSFLTFFMTSSEIIFLWQRLKSIKLMKLTSLNLMDCGVVSKKKNIRRKQSNELLSQPTSTPQFIPGRTLGLSFWDLTPLQTKKGTIQMTRKTLHYLKERWTWHTLNNKQVRWNWIISLIEWNYKEKTRILSNRCFPFNSN